MLSRYDRSGAGAVYSARAAWVRVSPNGLVVRAVLALALGASFVAYGAAARAGSSQLTIDGIVGPRSLTGVAPTDFVWAPDGSRYAYAVPAEHGAPVLFVHEMRTGSDRRLVSATSTTRGSRSRAIAQVVWAPDGHHVAFVNDGALDVEAAAGGRLRMLAHDVDDPRWSPDGTHIAYVHARNLYSIAVATGAVTRLTSAANAEITNGDPDWLYSEELDVAHAFAWSPNGRSIAYLSFDESHVASYPIVNFTELPLNTVESQHYPLAGTTNPRVSLAVVSADGSNARTLFDGGPHDEYPISFAWTPDSTSVVDEILDRAQRHLRLEAFPRDGSASRTLLRESDARFVDDSPAPRFIRGGASFLWISERAGIAALYRVDTASGTATRLTGAIPIGSIAGVDEAANRVYVHALFPSRRDSALLAIALEGHERAVRNLTPERGTHTITMSEHGGHFIDVYSSLHSPPRIERRSAFSSGATSIFRTPSLVRYALGTSSSIAIPSPYGPLDATLVLPNHLDPAKRYPVIVSVYGGPLPVDDGETSANRWPGLFAHLLAERGFISLYVDGPASLDDRTANVRSFSGTMGGVAIHGPLAAADWLARQPYVDAKRLGLFGWSYGGYLTAYTLTHAPTTFASGIAGAPPVDWRLYDTAYTERYLGTPQRNKAVYARTAVLPDIAALRAQLLVLQGSSDDNVHLANSMALLAAAVKAGKQVDYFVFPGARHGPRGTASQRYLDMKMLDWWQRTLGVTR